MPQCFDLDTVLGAALIGFWPGSLVLVVPLFALVVTGITLGRWFWELNLVIQGYNSRSISPGLNL